jgi:ATP-binding protein involved in chromosome partitioning
VIENMSGEFFGSGAGQKLATDYGVPYLGAIPLDAQIRKGGDSGEPIVIMEPDSPAGHAFGEITSAVAARVSVLTLSNQSDLIPIQMIG